MGARSDIHVVDHPYPVVFDALVASLPTAGFHLTTVDPDRGHIGMEARNTTLEVAVGAIDAITSEWVATAQRKIALLPARHDQQFRAIEDALGLYLVTYYA